MITLKELNEKVEKLRKDFIATKDLKLKDKIIEDIIKIKDLNKLENISDVQEDLKLQREINEIAKNDLKDIKGKKSVEVADAYNLLMSSKAMIANYENVAINNSKAIDRLVDGLKASLLVKEPAEKKN